MSDAYSAILAGIDFTDFLAVVVAMGLAVIGLIFVASLLSYGADTASGIGREDEPEKEEGATPMKQPSEAKPDDDRGERARRNRKTEPDNDYC